MNGPLVAAACRNETVGLAVRIDSSKLTPGSRARFVAPAREGASIALDGATIGQIRPIPVDLNRAGYVRQSGLDAAGTAAALPRAVVPLAMTNGSVSLDACKPTPELGGTLLWIDLPIPEATAAGDYVGAIELVDATGKVVGRQPLKATVYDLALPVARNLRILGEASWESLQAQFPDDFEAVTPRVLSRANKNHARAIGVLDAMVDLAQQHRLNLSVDRIQPIAKWSPGGATVEWDDFDGIVGPWLDGTAFADKEPLGLWPLPGVDPLENFPAAAQREYYEQAALHFDAKDWLSRAPVWLKDEGRGNIAAGPAKRRMLERAALILGSQPRVRVSVPLLAEQLEFADERPDQSTLPRRADDDRLLTASPGLIFNTPIVSNATPRRAPTFLRTDLAGLLPYAGTGGDERDVRVTAWLAFTRGASIIPFDEVLPRVQKPTDPADPNALVWFYPGSWFGVSGPVPSLQLKWLRRAEEDYEYLQLAKSRGQVINALVMARLLTKPVQIPPTQRADPIYTLMTGTADQKYWDEGMRLLAKTIQIRRPGEAPDEDAQIALNIETKPWLEAQEKPLLFGRTTLFKPLPDGKLDVRIGADIYNASDTTPSGNTISFAAVPKGWTIDPQPNPVAALATYQVQRTGLRAAVDPDVLDPRRRAEVNLNFTDGLTRRTTPAPMIVPGAVTRRHEGGLQMNGKLNDWTDDDALNLGPLVRMLDRPTLQQHTLAFASTPSQIYSAFSEANFYVAFNVDGLARNNNALQGAQNFVRYDFRRAWGEDVVQVLVQAIYADGSLGPVLHIACKPNGGQWSERKLDLREGADDATAWEPLESGARYSCTVTDAWRGELAIPWRAIHPPGFAEGPDRLPVALRFNFTQHQHATGTSATWAGPVDHGRDDQFMGVLVLRNETGR